MSDPHPIFLGVPTFPPAPSGSECLEQVESCQNMSGQILSEHWYTDHHSLKIWFYEILIKQNAGDACENKCPDVVEILLTWGPKTVGLQKVGFNIHIYHMLCTYQCQAGVGGGGEA